MFIENLQKMADQSNVGLFSRQQFQLDAESINALLRVAQAQQQQECFVPSSQINDTFIRHLLMEILELQLHHLIQH